MGCWVPIVSFLCLIFVSESSAFAQNAPICSPATGALSDKVPVYILQQAAREAEKAFRRDRSITKDDYLEALRKFVILRVAKAEANRKTQGAYVIEAAAIKFFEKQIFDQLGDLVGWEEAPDLIASWEQGATAEEKEELLKRYAISVTTYRRLFADLAKAKGLPEIIQMAAAKNESFEFVEFSAGEFVMGSPLTEWGHLSNEEQRRVVITKPFEMAKTEVTQLQWYLVKGDVPSYFNGPRLEYLFEAKNPLSINRPVETVSFNDVQDYIRRLNELDPKYNYRLPTEAEWEYAARAGGTSAYSVAGYIWEYADSGSATTSIVASRKPNLKGLYDVHGNVWEWCEDWYSDSSTEKVDPTGPKSGSVRVVRGGDFYWSWRSAMRFYNKPENRNKNVGFRLVRTPK